MTFSNPITNILFLNNLYEQTLHGSLLRKFNSSYDIRYFLGILNSFPNIAADRYSFLL